MVEEIATAASARLRVLIYCQYIAHERKLFEFLVMTVFVPVMNHVPDEVIFIRITYPALIRAKDDIMDSYFISFVSYAAKLIDEPLHSH